jgi:AcrR family transcriptional regulator
MDAITGGTSVNTTDPHDARASEVGVLWSSPPPARRGPKPRHTRESITDAAVAIADAEGLDAVTMQRVAADLGTTKMALYRYLPARADLDAAMLDRALGAPPAPLRANWQQSLAAWTRDLFARALARPWSVELAQRPHVPGPQELAWYEAGLEATEGLPLTGAERLDVLALLSGHALSLVRQQAGSATPESDLSARLAPVLAAHSDRYPQTAAAFAEATAAAAGGDAGGRDDALDFGVQRVLAGVATLAAQRDG